MSHTILVIDDHPDIRENIAEILELAGYRALVAENGKQGVEQALREKPSLIVCDIMMPELDGYGVLHLLRKNRDTQHIPFIFLTARTERHDFRKGMEMGADDYITKPFEEIELLHAIEIRLKKNAVLQQEYPSSPEGLAAFLLNSGNHKQASPPPYEVYSYDKKQTLYQEGKRPRFLYYLLSGKVKGFKRSDEGKEYITNLYTQGEFLGYTALLSDQPYEDNATILETAEIAQIPKEDFLQLINSDITIAAKFIQIITHNVQEKEGRLLTLAYSSLRKRVANALVDIATKFHEKEKLHPIEISREEIAQFVGTATESLIRTLSDFKASNYIEINNGRIVVRNLEKLKNLNF